ncbi:MAG TPA: glycosyltransferase family 4 protein [Blastocatellia bacterium]|nr:glycosyltransferase family 4 protein [Blastocatellia bacterium]
MNVLQLMCSFHQGGSERQAIQLARLLKESGRYNVHLAAINGEGVLRTDAEALGFRDIPEFPLTSFYNLNYARQLRRFARFLREREIAIVQSSDFYTNIFGMMGAALARVPVRIAAKRETTGWRNGPQRFVERCSYRLAHAVVANAEAVRSMLINQGVPANKIITIYNGLDAKRVETPVNFNRDDALQIFGLPLSNEYRYVTMVANLRSPLKNYPMFLRAARVVRAVIPEARFVIAGEGKLLEPMRALAAELGLSEQAFFIGRCQRIAELLALTEVCAFSPSYGEGFSNSILEYMAAARPVVATDVGGAREAIIEGETGYIVQPDDYVAMAERIISLLRDPERSRAMGEMGRRRVLENFSCEAQLERTHELYERTLARALSQLSKALSRAPQQNAIERAMKFRSRAEGMRRR